VIEASAPARANLIGNPSDQYGGCTLACSVPLRARVRLRAAPAGRVATDGAEARLDSPADLRPRGDAFDVVRAVLVHLGLPGAPCAIEYDSEVPLRSGMAGSTALVVALLAALLERGGRRTAGHALAETARSVERREMGVTCGYVDQYLAVFGGLQYVDFRGKTPEGAADAAGGEPFATVEPLAGLAPALPFVLAWTGVRHSSDAVHRPIRERWLAGEPAVRAAYERVAEIGRLGKRAFLLGDWPRLGALMNENHAIQRDLGGSGESNERLIAAALAAGAPGAKLAGAGQGGSVVALWPGGDPAPLESALRAAGAAALYRPEPVAGVQVEVR
jgi:galactokinase/mevalonate kinase-like predicted kinase